MVLTSTSSIDSTDAAPSATANPKNSSARNAVTSGALLVSALILLQLASHAPPAASASLARYASSDAAVQQLPWWRPPAGRTSLLGAPDFRDSSYGFDAGARMSRSVWHQKKNKDEVRERRGMSKRGFNVIPRYLTHLTSVPGRKLMGLQQRSSWSSEDGFSGYNGGRGGPRQFRLRWG